MTPNVGETPANGGRQPIGELSLPALLLPSADFTEGTAANPSLKCAGMRKTGGLTPAVRLSVCNCGVTSFSDAEPAEDAVQDVFRKDRADDLGEFIQRQAEFGGDEFFAGGIDGRLLS